MRKFPEALLQKPLSEWEDQVFEEYGIKNPNKHSNSTIVLDAIERTEAVPGDIVECGVYKGSSLVLYGLKLREMKSQRKLWGLDSFAGFPGASEADLIDGELPQKAAQSYFADTEQAQVQNLIDMLKLQDIVRLVPGFFDETCPRLPVEKISVLWLDCDLYDSYRVCLQYLYPLVSPGGYIIFDEYYSPKYPGARIAVDEFFTNKPEKPVLAEEYLQYHPYERWYVIKT